MKRSGWLSVGLCLAALALPGCMGFSKPAGAKAASAAASPSNTGQAPEKPSKQKASSREAEAALTKEEGHPFWNVVGGAAGCIGLLLIIALMAGGF